MRIPKDEKLQVLLSSDDLQRLKRIILQQSMEEGHLMTVSSYVRNLIINHIRDHEGEQLSLTNEKVKELVTNLNQEKNNQ
jgi:hypothetical protein